MLYVLLRVVRSPFGHVLVAIRENQLRATFQGYPVARYKLAIFVLSATVTGLAGALLGRGEGARADVGVCRDVGFGRGHNVPSCGSGARFA